MQRLADDTQLISDAVEQWIYEVPTVCDVWLSSLHFQNLGFWIGPSSTYLAQTSPNPRFRCYCQFGMPADSWASPSSWTTTSPSPVVISLPLHPLSAMLSQTPTHLSPSIRSSYQPHWCADINIFLCEVYRREWWGGAMLVRWIGKQYSMHSTTHSTSFSASASLDFWL